MFQWSGLNRGVFEAHFRVNAFGQSWQLYGFSLVSGNCDSLSDVHASGVFAYGTSHGETDVLGAQSALSTSDTDASPSISRQGWRRSSNERAKVLKVGKSLLNTATNCGEVYSMVRCSYSKYYKPPLAPVPG